MMLKDLKSKIMDAVRAAFDEPLNVERFTVSYAEPQFGDFATNAALVYAKSLRRPPREVAETVAGQLRTALKEAENVEVAGPGFINIRMKPAFWAKELAKIDADFARLTEGAGQKVQVEYISANPTGPTTIGNARGGFIGDVLSRVLDRAGYDVTREYYFNNAGTQISKLLESVKMEAGLIPETEERQYRGDYVKELARDFKAELSTRADDEMGERLANEILKRYIEPAVAAMGIRFDVWFNEKDLIKDGSFERTVELLRERGLVFERDGAVWLKTGELGDERGERVIIKSNGDPTYMAPDIAYHADIFGRRKFDYAIKVLGPDHVAQFPSVHAAVQALYPDKRLRMAGYQWLRVVRDGKEVKVSKRLGQFITIADLIRDVGLPVARFLTLMRSADSHMDFDLDLAREQSAKNPYYYVMYAYARANSILAKADEKGLKVARAHSDLSQQEVAITRHMSQLPELVHEMAQDFGVHRLTFFGLELARLFQDYYESERIIGLPAKEAESKLYFVQRFIIFMDIYWGLLGIEPLKRLEQA